MKNMWLIILFFSFLIFYSGCDNNDNITESPTGYYWGGNVLLWTENGSTIDDRSGVKIYLEGTNYHTFTDQQGNWKIYNIPAGIYSLVAKKEGFGYHKFIHFEYNGNTNNNNFGQTLIATPTYHIDSVSLSNSNGDILLTGFPSNVVSNLRFVLIYLGKQDPIYDSTTTWDFIIESQIYGGNDFFTVNFNNSFLMNNGYANGDTVHIAVYPGSRIVERYFVLEEYKLINSSGVGPNPKRFNYVIP